MAVAGSTDFMRRVLLGVQRNANLDVREFMVNYELSAYPLALFDERGDLRVMAKSALLNVIKPSCTDPTSPSCRTSSHQVLILDGMALLQMFPAGGVKIFNELCMAFFEMITRSMGYQEVHLVFYPYDIGASLKDRTRHSRTKAASCSVDIQPSTQIPAGMSLAKILSINSNKNTLTILIATKSQSFPWTFAFVCSWKDKIIGSPGKDVKPFACAHEEADTKIIYHLSRLPKTTDVTVVSPDTDFLVLLICHFSRILKETKLRLGKNLYNIGDVHETVGRRTDVITTFHALMGCDTVGSFFRKGKLVAWAVFVKANNTTLAALAKLQGGQKNEESLKAVLLFISQIYMYDCPLP